MKNIIFDTNAYRGIGKILKHKTVDEKNDFKKKFLISESVKGYNRISNTFVILELLQHLVNIEDTAYSDCKEAILFSISTPEKSSLIPLLDDYLALRLFKKMKQDSIGFNRIEALPNLLHRIIQSNGSDKIIENLRPNLNFMADLLNDYRDMLIEDFKVTSANFTSLENPWFISKEGDSIKRLMQNKNKFYLMQSEIILRRVTDYLEINYESMGELEKQEKIHFLKDNYQFAFKLLLELNDKMFNKNYNLETKKQIREVIDIMIAFSINKTDDFIFVTNEVSLLRVSKELSMENQVLSLDEYLKSIEFSPPQ